MPNPFALRSLAALLLMVMATGAAAQTLAPPGAKPQALQLKEGDRVVLTMVPGDLPKIVSSAPADLSDLQPPQSDNRVETLATKPRGPNSAASDTFVATLKSFGPKGSVLRVENGYDQPLLYDAVLLKRQGERVVVQRTSICPILAKGVGTEGWSEPLEGVAIFNVRFPASGDLRCTGPNNLTVTPPAAVSNVCTGQASGSPVSVHLRVDPATGAVRAGEAVWTLSSPGGPAKGPMVLLEYPMQGDLVGGKPVSLQVVAFAPFQPPPTAKTASIVLLADGAERFRRPWGLYAQRRAQLSTLPAGAQAVGFVGVVPFPRTDDNTAPADYAAFLGELGSGRLKTLEVRVVGDDGSVLGASVYSVGGAPTTDSGKVALAIGQAKAAAAAPSHCAKPPQQTTSPAR